MKNFLKKFFQTFEKKSIEISRNEVHKCIRSLTLSISFFFFWKNLWKYPKNVLQVSLKNFSRVILSKNLNRRSTEYSAEAQDGSFKWFLRGISISIHNPRIVFIKALQIFLISFLKKYGIILRLIFKRSCGKKFYRDSFHLFN